MPLPQAPDFANGGADSDRLDRGDRAPNPEMHRTTVRESRRKVKPPSNAPRVSCAAQAGGRDDMKCAEHVSMLAHKRNSAKAGRRQLQPLVRCN